MAKNKSAIMLSSLVALCMVSGCATGSKLGAYGSVARAATLPKTDYAYDWAKVLPGPPTANSAQDIYDMSVVRSFQAEPNAERRRQAVLDNGFDPFASYRPIMGENFTVLNNPEMGALWTYSGRQLSVNSNAAKDRFPRPRPFLASPEVKSCVDNLPGGSSYPSGHSAWGWISAQLLAKVYPDKTSQILERGREYGQSRVVCGVHYPSDVADGRLMGDAILLGLENDSEFLRLLAAAKARVRH